MVVNWSYGPQRSGTLGAMTMFRSSGNHASSEAYPPADRLSPSFVPSLLSSSSLSLSVETVTQQVSHYAHRASECHTVAAQCRDLDAPSCADLRTHHALAELRETLHRELTHLGRNTNTMAENLRTTAKAVVQADEDCAGGFGQ